MKMAEKVTDLERPLTLRERLDIRWQLFLEVCHDDWD